MLQEFVQKQKDLIRRMIGEIHTAMPGTIESVDYEEGLVNVLPALKMKLPNGELINYPLITGVPVLTFSSNSTGVSVTLPVVPGDTCWIMISEQSLDAWMYGMDTNADLPFDLTNAICIPGLSPTLNAEQQKANDEKAVIVRAGEQKLTISPEGIRIDGDLHIAGNISADGALSVAGQASASEFSARGVSLSGHTHTSSASGSPTSAPISS